MILDLHDTCKWENNKKGRQKYKEYNASGLVTSHIGHLFMRFSTSLHSDAILINCFKGYGMEDKNYGHELKINYLDTF